MNFGNIKKWELVSLGVVAAAAVVFRVLEWAGIFVLPRVPAIIFLMAFAAFLFLRSPILLLTELVRKKTANKEKLAAAGIDALFALIAEGVLIALLLMS